MRKILTPCLISEKQRKSKFKKPGSRNKKRRWKNNKRMSIRSIKRLASNSYKKKSRIASVILKWLKRKRCLHLKRIRRLSITNRKRWRDLRMKSKMITKKANWLRFPKLKTARLLETRNRIYSRSNTKLPNQALQTSNISPEIHSHKPSPRHPNNKIEFLANTNGT